MDQIQSLRSRWARGEKLSSIAKELGVKRGEVRAILGIPSKGSNEIYPFRVSLLAPHLAVVGVDKRKSEAGVEYVYLTVEDTRNGTLGSLPSEELTYKLRSDPLVYLFSATPSSRETSLNSILAGKSEQDAAIVLRWARGESLSKIAKEVGQSRGRMSLRLGLPQGYSEDYFRIRLQAYSSNFSLVGVRNSTKSTDKVLKIRDNRTGKETEHPSSWVFKCLGEDSEYTFFPSTDEVMRKRFRNGTATLVNGMTQRQYAQKIGSSYATVNVAVRRFGDEAASILDSFSRTESTLENVAASWFDSDVVIVRNKKLEGTPYFPDILLPEFKIIIECDGLFWHSEAQKPDKNYHKKKRDAYLAHGFRPFFFREDEILSNPSICRSIAHNFMGKNLKVFARTTEVVNGDSSFFSSFHLMGKGSGTVYSLVDKNGDTLASIQLKFKSVRDKVLDVSRFCSKPGVTVVGGFSKLVSHAIRELQPNKVQTFIDLRYGDGTYLKSLGWNLVSQHLSFVWTDARGNSFHRMKFPGSTGHQNGMLRVWDCGQAKWELNLNP